MAPLISAALKTFKDLSTDLRLRKSIVLFAFSLFLLISAYLLHVAQKNRLDSSLLLLSTKTNELCHRLDVKHQQSKIPKFEASMHAVGAYHPLLSSMECASRVTYCFLQKTKPYINIKSTLLEMEPLHALGSFVVKFKSSYDYEIFAMMEYIFSNPQKFGLNRLREFEIEQIFETSPIVKGCLVYDQLSLKP